MASKKNNFTLILFLLLAAFAAGAWYFSKEEKTLDKTELIKQGMRFKTGVKDVQKIFIAQRDGTTTTLERKDDYWIVNGKHKANPNIMRNMMTTIGAIDVKFIPTKASNEHIIKEMAAIGIKVELYNKKNQLLKAYYVGGSTNDELGTYMIMEGSDQPYVVHIPSLEGGVRWRFTPKDETWRDKTVFSEKEEDIKYISVEYPTQKDKAFKFVRTNSGKYEVTPFHDFVPASAKTVNEVAAKSFLIGFKKIIAEGFETKNINRDSVVNSVPFSIIKVGKTDGTEKSVRFFPLDADEKRALTGETLPVHRYYAELDEEDFLLMQQRVVGKLFWSYGQFFK